MPNSDQKSKAEALRALHSAKDVLLLPNVWDAASARIIENADFPAIATTSAGVAFAEGFPDGEKIPARRMIAAVAKIAAAVRVPVTADVEAGYGPKPEDAARTAEGVIESGAVGMNFEDATGEAAHPLFELSLQLERIHAIRDTAARLGVALVLNTRTDVYLLQVGEDSTRYDEAVKRLQAYRDAGSDCVFLPGVRDKEIIRRVVTDLRCPVNILAGPGSPSVAELAALGVKRISLGSGPMRATLGLLRRLGNELKATGTYDALAGAPPHSEINALMGSSGSSTN